ncbi:TRIC cation channel family protein, partial [Escherichia coli]|uniref:TRIC cation channel family protein n=1 Tax=Escherichia coli TaxID=562 RepID=UPI00148582F1
DPFGVLVLGVVTAVGGGTIRDMALDDGPVGGVKDPTEVVVAMVTSMRNIVRVREQRRLTKWMLPGGDAVGVAGVGGSGVKKGREGGGVGVMGDGMGGSGGGGGGGGGGG